MTCTECGKPVSYPHMGRANTHPGACRQARNRKLWRANSKRYRQEGRYRMDDGVEQARAWLRRQKEAA